MDIIPRAAGHVNRFVREAVLHLCAALATAGSVEDLRATGFDMLAAGLLAKGLCDNWSQV